MLSSIYSNGSIIRSRFTNGKLKNVFNTNQQFFTNTLLETDKVCGHDCPIGIQTKAYLVFFPLLFEKKNCILTLHKLTIDVISILNIFLSMNFSLTIIKSVIGTYWSILVASLVQNNVYVYFSTVYKQKPICWCFLVNTHL